MDIYTVIIIMFGGLLIIGLITTAISQSKVDNLKKYEMIGIGMPEAQMIQIMGNGFNRSLLKNNRVKYEWRINATSSSYSVNGFTSRKYKGVKKVTIYTKNGFVEEVKPYNV